MTAATINTYRDVTERIYRNYGIGAEQLANIAQSIAVALMNDRIDRGKSPSVHVYVWKQAESDLRDFIGYVTAIRQDILTQEAQAQLTGELFQAEATQ